MSGDEIIFGEMKVREPERRQRPDRDRRFACIAYEVPGPADLPIFLDRRAADAIERHALADTSVELGGILLGKECLDQQTGQPFVWVTHSLEAKHYANTQASFTYTHDTWEEITRERDLKFPDFDIVGWYHTHPSFGIFLSHHDLFIHQNFFSQPLQVAYVVDPINQTRGFFHLRDVAMVQVAGYHLVADRADRVALARLVNDLEQVPNSDATSGGTFSPRLEAELINMLSRPAHREMTIPIQGAQFAAIYGIFGVLLGMLIVAAAVWLFQFQAAMQDQTASLRSLKATVEESAAAQSWMGDTLRDKLGSEKGSTFLDDYNVARRGRDDARKRLEDQRMINENLATENRQLEEQISKKTVELELATKDRDRYEKASDDLAKGEKALAKLHETNERQRAELDKLEPLFETADGKKAVETHQQLNRWQYAAYAGWACSALLSLGLISLYFYYKPIVEGTSEATERPAEAADRPTHRIE